MWTSLTWQQDLSSLRSVRMRTLLSQQGSQMVVLALPRNVKFKGSAVRVTKHQLKFPGDTTPLTYRLIHGTLPSIITRAAPTPDDPRGAAYPPPRNPRKRTSGDLDGAVSAGQTGGQEANSKLQPVDEN